MKRLGSITRQDFLHIAAQCLIVNIGRIFFTGIN